MGTSIYNLMQRQQFQALVVSVKGKKEIYGS